MWRRDPRVREWPLMGAWGGVLVFTILFTYSLVVMFGQRLVRPYVPVPLRYPIGVYNLAQVLLCSYMTWEFAAAAVGLGLSPVCARIDRSDSPSSLRLTKVCWLFMTSKILDMVDTAFMILKGDKRRVSFLHVFHHGSVFYSWWLCVMFSPGGVGYTGGFINSLIHVLMYAYYQLSSMGPEMRKHLWWKRYLTLLQMVQFCCLIGVAALTRLPGLRCGYPEWVSIMTFCYIIVLLVFFINFYVKTYVKSRRTERQPLQQLQETAKLRQLDAPVTRLVGRHGSSRSEDAGPYSR